MASALQNACGHVIWKNITGYQKDILAEEHYAPNSPLHAKLPSYVFTSWNRTLHVSDFHFNKNIIMLKTQKIYIFNLANN